MATPSIIITDRSNNRIVKRLASDLSYVSKIGIIGIGDDDFALPRSIAQYGGFIYVADTSNNRIVKRSAIDLSYVTSLSVTNPQSLCTDGTYLYVIAEVNAYKIYKYLLSDLSYTGQSFGTGSTSNDPTVGLNIASGLSTDGTYLYVGGSAGVFIIKLLSSSMTYVIHRDLQGGNDSGAGFYWQGNCSDGTYVWFIASQSSHVVKVNSSDFSTVWVYGTAGSGDDQFSFLTGGSGDPGFDGTYLYIADTANNRIKKHLASDGSYVSKIGSLGSGDDQFSSPYGAAFYPGDLNLPPVASASSGLFSNTISFTSIPYITSYNIYWSFSPGVTTSDTKIAGVTSPYIHSPLTSGITIYYIVTSVSPYADESVPSNEVSATPRDSFLSYGYVIW